MDTLGRILPTWYCSKFLRVYTPLLSSIYTPSYIQVHPVPAYMNSFRTFGAAPKVEPHRTLRDERGCARCHPSLRCGRTPRAVRHPALPSPRHDLHPSRPAPSKRVFPHPPTCLPAVPPCSPTEFAVAASHKYTSSKWPTVLSPLTTTPSMGRHCVAPPPAPRALGLLHLLSPSGTATCCCCTPRWRGRRPGQRRPHASRRISVRPLRAVVRAVVGRLVLTDQDYCTHRL